MKKRVFYNITGVLFITLIIIGLLFILIANNSLIGKVKYDSMYIVDYFGIIAIALGLVSLLVRVLMFVRDRDLPPIFFKGPFTKLIEKKKVESNQKNANI